ncbi:hypothetical protein K458DRAFT_414763 [Lentithecium fluviatile CBS 122367]|uniref:NYN domain-containing protein n=1 Tax=Lentithecium fluviatile CBS 122367 TaxID=1168545 RepID=A0A6G1JB94_9PLEO|nr:hypothetical protein K458DRAFT_414763 [Lentithecium fluviatile CBS 122367]
MPSQAFDTGWDFGPVLGLIDSDLHIASPGHSPASQAIVPARLEKHEKNTSSEGGLQLGNFGRLFKQLGFANDRPPDPISPAEADLEEPSSPDDAAHAPFFAKDEPAETANGDAGLIPPKGPTTDVTHDLPACVTGTPKPLSSKQARRASRKERKAQKKLMKELTKEQEMQKKLQGLVDAVPGTPTPRNEPVVTQTRYPLRSNVGAKIRPATPVQIDNLATFPKRAASPTKQGTTTAKPYTSPVRRPALVPPQPLSSLAQPFTPVPAGIQNALCQHSPSVGYDPATQFVAYGTPSPFHYAPSQMQFYPTGYFAPQVAGPVGHGNGLIPRTVQPVIQQRAPHSVPVPQMMQNPATPSKGPRRIIIRPQVDRHVHFLSQLMSDFPEDKKWLVSPMQLCNEKRVEEGIHVFVDASNIMIGFNDILRRYGLQSFHLSFDSLALLMERRRPVAKRVSASSHREAAPLPHVTKLVDTSKAVGYENNVKEQVYIRREDSERKKFFKEVDRFGWNKAVQRRSGNGSGSDSEMNPATPMTPSAPKWVEQGVDEILHLKMCQSIIDTEAPTIIVLATGDGAEAEHSDGFLAHVERALKKGWQVELLSWRQQTSGGYKNKKFRSKWGDKFRMIELDDYLESLIDTP